MKTSSNRSLCVLLNIEFWCDGKDYETRPFKAYYEIFFRERPLSWIMWCTLVIFFLRDSSTNNLAIMIWKIKWWNSKSFSYSYFEFVFVTHFTQVPLSSIMGCALMIYFFFHDSSTYNLWFVCLSWFKH